MCVPFSVSACEGQGLSWSNTSTENHKEAANCVEAACLALWSLAADGACMPTATLCMSRLDTYTGWAERTLDMMHDLNVVSSILQCLDAHKASVKVATQAITLLASAVAHEGCAESIVDNESGVNGIQLVSTIVTTHIMSEDLLESACVFFEELADHEDMRFALKQFGALQALAMVLVTYKMDGRVRQSAQAALKAILHSA